MRIALAAILGILLACGAARAASCPDGQELPRIANKRIVIAKDTLFFASHDLQLDHDGSPEAYGVRDQGLEGICNGLAPLRPPECRGRNRGACFKACQSAFAAWSRNGAQVETLGDSMCSIGLGGGGCSPPSVRLQPPPRQDWFVSETSVRVAPPPGAPIAGWSASQAAQLDPARTAYFVIPGAFRKMPWDATPGDAGIVLDANSGRTVAFVVGDTGGALDEASTAVHAGLRGSAFPPTGKRTSALGERVDSYLAGTNGDFRIAIFRHTASRSGASTMLTLTSEKLGPWIEATAQARLQAIGGADRVRDCAK
ncbi:MAG: hypothetical protein IPK66_15430 [Rhodospirillales bacterium]|nr:hypothetical protein [Rhodospirillales bacterium]